MKTCKSSPVSLDMEHVEVWVQLKFEFNIVRQGQEAKVRYSSSYIMNAVLASNILTKQDTGD
jgi:hypothetical protein